MEQVRNNAPQATPTKKASTTSVRSDLPQTREELTMAKLTLTYKAMNKPIPSGEVLGMMAEDLCDEVQDDLVLDLALKHLRRTQDWISVKGILEIAHRLVPDGRPEPEAAWAMCPKTEDLSIVWTDEMAEAFGLVRGLLADGDEIAARMAFKEHYTRLLGQVRAIHKPVRWTASLGWEPTDRVRALTEAIEKRRIGMDAALALLAPEQAQSLRLALPPAELKLLKGESTPASRAQLTGLQLSLVQLREAKALPDGFDTPTRRRVEMTDVERAAHAKRVREQAAAITQKRVIRRKHGK